MADDSDVVKRLAVVRRRHPFKEGHAMTDLVERLRTFWREVTESDGGESPQMAMTREAADEIERLRACLRENVIWTNIRTPNHGTCGNCNGKWSDGIEAHEPGCLAALTTTEKADGQS